MNYIFKLLLIFFVVLKVQADCNVCQNSNGVACQSGQLFSVCEDGLPTKNLQICPDNTICTSGPNVCYPENTFTIPSCVHRNLNHLLSGTDSLCAICDEHKVFACLNETTIAFCFGASVPNMDAISYCPNSTVCDITNAKYCSSSAQAEPSCSSFDTTTTIATTDETTTTSAGPRDPDTICKDAGSKGLYKTDDDTTCTKFVNCFEIGGQLKGVLQTCPNDQYFHHDKRRCTTDKPEGCP